MNICSLLIPTSRVKNTTEFGCVRYLIRYGNGYMFVGHPVSSYLVNNKRKATINHRNRKTIQNGAR